MNSSNNTMHTTTIETNHSNACNTNNMRNDMQNDSINSHDCNSNDATQLYLKVYVSIYTHV